MELQLLPSHKIDRLKWDACLHTGNTQLIYASSAYLDHMADNWDGIVGDNYDFIMPLPWRKKYGIRYAYHVPFVQQLGIYGKTLEQNDADAFYRLLQQTFTYGDYSFNFSNKIANGTVCKNYMLSLASNYRSTSFFYSDKLKADLIKAEQKSLVYGTADLDEVINMFTNLYAKKIASVTANNYKSFSDLCALKEKEGNLITRKIASGEKTFAMVLLLKDKYRFYNLMSCTTPEGRGMFAGHFMYDNLIKEFSQTGMILDFEGSEIPGIAHFYKSFGAINQPYHKIHINRLPLLLRLFKR